MVLLFGAGLAACGVKAPPRPPGIPAAKRGELVAPCSGCEIPGPDAFPAPSSPSPNPIGSSAPANPPGRTGKEGEIPPGLPGPVEVPAAPDEGAPSVEQAPPKEEPIRE
ncbi:hypothetical protein AKJ08_2160 [Vulgatibacter incomptus]|uniref:Uncharacterized protein n=1 Tax=Vulgatibacter incomptus TaxID=1391653 RepID=A0A0K1PE11_9BACT|nr:hypothetical protein AKJ08_2160 [Vulgatibacter incomptus]